MTHADALKVSLDWGDLVIAGPCAQIDQFLDEIDRSLPSGWIHNTAAENEALRRGMSPPRSHCYSYKLTDRESCLWLYCVSDRRVQGGLVAPSDPNPDRYIEDIAKAILDFRERVLVPVAKTCRMSLSRNRLGPVSWVPDPVLYNLWVFYESSQLDWPPTGDTIRRWREFVFSAHQSPGIFDPEEFTAWFTEKGWRPEAAKSLVEQFYSDVTLLSEYDDIREMT
jgi:hypothetical protein